MYMRFVRVKVREGKHWEYAQFYEDRVIPDMQETEGCLFASLLQPSGDDDESVSMTMWRSQKFAEAYEMLKQYDWVNGDRLERLKELGAAAD